MFGYRYETLSLVFDILLLQRAIATKEKLKEIEKDVPTFTNRPQKKFITSHADDLRPKRFVIISFESETSCGGKEAEIIQLAAQTEQGQTFSRFVLPKKGISFHASRVNKFQTASIGGKKVLHRGGNPLETLKPNVSSPLLIL